MPRLEPGSQEAQAIDAALADWRQGDLALEERWFVHVGDPAHALTDAAAEVKLIRSPGRVLKHYAMFDSSPQASNAVGVS